MKTKRKVLAYITRGQGPDLELLVFTHRDYPEAGLQVPGGTVEEGEQLIDAMYREIFEETGISFDDLSLAENIHTYNYYPFHQETIHERTFFHLNYLGNQVEWEHLVFCEGEDNGLVFQFRWERVESLPLLSGDQGAAMGLL